MLNSDYLQQLIQKTKSLDCLQNHALLKGQWKNAGFILLSQLIQDKLDKILDDDQKMAMGTTIHARTLTDTFRGKKNYDNYLHPHALNTLNKLSIFANYQSWDNFIQVINKELSTEIADQPVEKVIELLIRKAMASEFAVYQNLPSLQEALLDPPFIKEETAFKNIVNNLIIAKEKNWTIANSYNPSSNKLLDHSFKLLTTTTAQVTAKEQWLLAWWHLQQEEYVYRYQKTIETTYLLEKVDGIWKIKTSSSNNNFLKVSITEIKQQQAIAALETNSVATIKTLIRKAMALELQLYTNVSTVQPKLLLPLFIETGTAFKELSHNLLIAKEKNWTINNADNPSSNDLIDCSIKQITPNTAQIITKEYWLLWWWHPLDKKYVYRHKEVSDHIYLLEKIDNQWTIKTNASGADSLRIPLD